MDLDTGYRYEVLWNEVRAMFEGLKTDEEFREFREDCERSWVGRPEGASEDVWKLQMLERHFGLYQELAFAHRAKETRYQQSLQAMEKAKEEARKKLEDQDG